MCGIVGVFDTRGKREIDRQLLSRMNQLQVHRGPDEGELYTEPGVGFGHRRLSIMDVSSGQQPLFNEDGTVVVVFNGEIYNFQSCQRVECCGPRLPYALRYGSDRARLGGVGRAVRGPFPWDVRLRPVGSQPRNPVSGTRQARYQTALLQSA